MPAPRAELEGVPDEHHREPHDQRQPGNDTAGRRIFQTGLPGPRLPLTVLVALATLPLAWRRRAPVRILALTGGSLLAVGWLGQPNQSAFPLLLALLVAVYSLAACATARAAFLGGAFVLLAGAA